MPIILKLQCQDEIYRARLEERPARLEDLDLAIQRVLPGLSARRFKYADAEGDLCTLCEATLPDFLAGAEGARAAMKLLLDPAPPSVAPDAPAVGEVPVADPPVAGQPALDALTVGEIPVADPPVPGLDALTVPVAGQPELDSPGATPVPIAEASPVTRADEPSTAGQPEARPAKADPPAATSVNQQQRRERWRGPLRPAHALISKVFGPHHLHRRGPLGTEPKGLAVHEIAAILRQDLGLEGSVHDVVHQASAILGVPSPTSGGLKWQADLCYQRIYCKGPLQGPMPAVGVPGAEHSVHSVLKRLSIAAKGLQDQGSLSVVTLQELLRDFLPELAKTCSQRQGQLNACGPWLREQLVPILQRAHVLFSELEELQPLRPLVEEYASGADVGCLGDFLAPSLAVVAARTEDPAVQEGLRGVAEELLPVLQRRLAQDEGRHECFQKGFSKGCFWKGFGKGFAAGLEKGLAKGGSKCNEKGKVLMLRAKGRGKGCSRDQPLAKDSSVPPVLPGTESGRGAALAEAGASQGAGKVCEVSPPPSMEPRGDRARASEEIMSLVDMGLCESAEEAQEALAWYGGDVLATVEGLASSGSASSSSSGE